eukprot:gnl/MRDRNA2_/MRDRNA2_218815_c0_seq1.p1 gnl/MRDRNA2_/MRDRNA2_218815_c0~~gnl/MRDRNA2_/MRDRNA2_218815_c0_seq1.p1  ORF type:complete len:356 (-),score=62.39 gnl/MRDRNA2_/MRDRNA2_218815_c0_seq1:183-1151(-)
MSTPVTKNDTGTSHSTMMRKQDALRLDLWPEVMQMLLVDDGAAILSQCCRRLAEIAAAKHVQCALWEHEGILWAVDVQPSHLNCDMAQFLWRWRRGVRANRTWYKLGTEMVSFQASDAWTFTSLLQLQLLDAALKHELNIADDTEFLCSEVSIPRCVLQQVLAAYHNERMHGCHECFGDEDEDANEDLAADVDIQTYMWDSSPRSENGTDVDRVVVQVQACPPLIENPGGRGDLYKIGSTYCRSYVCYLLDECHNRLAYGLGSAIETDAQPLDFMFDFEARCWSSDQQQADVMAFEWLDFLCRSPFPLPVKVIVFPRQVMVQ